MDKVPNSDASSNLKKTDVSTQINDHSPPGQNFEQDIKVLLALCNKRERST